METLIFTIVTLFLLIGTTFFITWVCWMFANADARRCKKCKNCNRICGTEVSCDIYGTTTIPNFCSQYIKKRKRRK